MIKCGRCEKVFRVELLDQPNRCTDWRCPVMAPSERLARAQELGRTADILAREDRLATEELVRHP
jgi:hypothetical protein